MNGAAINAANSLSIAGAAGGKSVTASIAGEVGAVPPGARLNAGDVVTVDITSVPATTQPKGGFIVLDIIELDI